MSTWVFSIIFSLAGEYQTSGVSRQQSRCLMFSSAGCANQETATQVLALGREDNCCQLFFISLYPDFRMMWKVIVFFKKVCIKCTSVACDFWVLTKMVEDGILISKRKPTLDVWHFWDNVVDYLGLIYYYRVLMKISTKMKSTAVALWSKSHIQYDW